MRVPKIQQIHLGAVHTGLESHPGHKDQHLPPGRSNQSDGTTDLTVPRVGIQRFSAGDCEEQPTSGLDPAPHCGLMGERTIFLASAVLRLGTASLTCKDGPYVPSTHCARLLPERVQVTSS